MYLYHTGGGGGRRTDLESVRKLDFFLFFIFFWQKMGPGKSHVSDEAKDILI